MQLDGKVAIVTGSASGIGKRIAEVYAQQGAAVAIADLNLDGAQAAAQELARSGAKAIGVKMDVTDEAEVDAGVAAVVKAYGKVDILVSNAGVQIVKAVEDFSLAEWKKMLAIHLDGAFLTTRACMSFMHSRVVRKAPSRWIASIFFQSAKLKSVTALMIWMPALETSTSTRP